MDQVGLLHKENSSVLQSNTGVKYRWYAKKDYIGVSPINWDLTCLGDRWLLCCVIAKDSAADLVCAVPMNRLSQPVTPTLQSKNTPLDLETNRQVPKLDSIIADAKSRHK